MRRNFTQDDLLELKDAGLVASSAAATVSGEAQVLDLGEGYVEGNILIDITALEIDSSNEIYDIVAQVSSSSTFATDTLIFDRCSMTFADDSPKRTDSNSVDTTGRYVLPFDNEYKGTCYRYMRLYTVVAGTIGTGINYRANFCKAL